MDQTYACEVTYLPQESPYLLHTNPRQPAYQAALQQAPPTVKGPDRKAALRALDGRGAAAQNQLGGLAGESQTGAHVRRFSRWKFTWHFPSI